MGDRPGGAASHRLPTRTRHYGRTRQPSRRIDRRAHRRTRRHRLVSAFAAQDTSGIAHGLLANPQIPNRKQRVERIPRTFDILPRAFFPIDRRDNLDNLSPGFRDYLGRFDGLSAGRRDVFNDDNLIAGLKFPFKLLSGAVILDRKTHV